MLEHVIKIVKGQLPHQQDAISFFCRCECSQVWEVPDYVNIVGSTARHQPLRHYPPGCMSAETEILLLFLRAKAPFCLKSNARQYHQQMNNFQGKHVPEECRSDWIFDYLICMCFKNVRFTSQGHIACHDEEST